MKTIRFALVGGIGFIIDGALFYLLVKLQLEVMPARLLAFWLSATFTWLGNKYITFNCQQRSRLLAQWFKHMVSAHFSGIANLSSFYVLSWYISLELAFAVGVMFGAVFNYWLSAKFVFRAPERQA